MPDEPDAQPPETPPAYRPGRRVGTGLAGETTRGEGSTILPGASQRPLEVIGDFEVIGKLGQGGMGAVYRARQISLDRQVALKLLPPNFEADADYVSRFQREARLAASLSHPNLVKVYSAGVADGSHYIAMELVEGETLGQWVKRGAMPPLEALRITLDVARALECGWRTAQLIHRDIKPGNIFLSAEGDVKLGDLGLAKIVGSDSTGLTHTGAAMGTPHYISPEQARGDKDLDLRADIYSLGCTLYQMLTKQTPYSGRDPVVVINQHINAPPPAILKVMPECPLPLARLVSKMLKKQRRERQASYEELIAQIESVQAQLDPSLTAPTIPAPSAPDPVLPVRTGASAESSPPAPAKSRMAMYGGAGVLVLAVAAFFLWPRPEKLTKAETYARDHATQFKAAKEAAEAEEATKAALAAATKDAPFVNTLGMKFVPVPIFGGPTSGHRGSPQGTGQPLVPGAATSVLFSVWDTRNQDYEVFANETKLERPKESYWLGPTRPAVFVSWDDATAFCAWLTDRERKAGKIGANEVYRLPTDHEWSCAVGIGEGEDAAMLPNAKSGKIAGVFPWGTQWPPPDKAGNYAGEELRPLLAAGKYPWLTEVLPGYNDGFAETSPVGSYAANRFGIYDLGGNVWQWCEDWYDADQKERVLRGASWRDSYRGILHSSYRDHNKPTVRYDPWYGFRCVLGVSAPAVAATATALEPGAIKLWDAPEKIPQDPHLRWEDNALRIDGWGLPYYSSKSRDALLRARIRMNPDANSPQLNLRTSTTGAENCYSLGIQPGEKVIQLHTVVDGRFQTLKEWPLPRAYGPDEWAQLELRAIGSELSASIDGQLLGTVRDTSHPGPGGISIYAKAAGYFRDIVYVPLDGTAAANPAAAPAAEPWQDVLHDPAKLVLSGGVARTAEGLRFTDASGAWLPHGPQGDGAIRLRATFGGLRVRLLARNRETVGAYSLYVKDEKLIFLGRWDQVAGEHRILREFSLPEPLKPGQDYTLELRVVGQTLTAKLNGEILGTVTDGTFPRGSFQVNVQEHDASPTLVKSLDFLDLDAPASGENGAPVGAGSTAPRTTAPAPLVAGKYQFTPGQWMKIFTKSEDLPAANRKVGNLRWRDGWIEAASPGVAPTVQVFGNEVHNHGIRLHGKVLPGVNQSVGCTIWVRGSFNGNNGADYSLVFSGRSTNPDLVFEYYDKTANKSDHFTNIDPDPALKPGDEFDMELFAIGDKLIGRFNGKLLPIVTDARLTAGNVGFQASYAVRDVEVLNLDGLSEAEALKLVGIAANPASATRDAPFVNTLGMKFVPVPGTKALFSIWDTRVQDYAAYALVKKVDDSWTKQEKDGVPVSREPDYPVVGVSWEDAQNFNQWLTNKEIGEGKLPQGAKYRLPTDEEWSWAVGLPPELGSTPAEKNDKNSVDFPWGKEYPPRSNAGNYADETFHAKFPINENAKEDWNKNKRWIEGYTDGYATTSPVGSFPVNACGLYDMGGNVWQWCEDWFDASRQERVVRGGSWNSSERGPLQSSGRTHNPPTSRYTANHGFRCVLVPAR